MLVLTERQIHETYTEVSPASVLPPAGADRKYVQAFTATTVLIIPGPMHGLGTADLLLQCYDDQTPRHSLGAIWSVDASSYEVQVHFEQPQTGRVILMG